MPKLHFTNGFVREMEESEVPGFMKRLANANIRYWASRINGDMVFLESPGMAFFEREMPDGSDDKEKEVPSSSETVEERKEAVEETKKEEDPAVKALEEMTAKSNCHKNGHEGQNQIIYKQIMNTTRNGKRQQSERYFPVCEFCGFKGRFIAKDKLSEEIRETAKPWKE